MKILIGIFVLLMAYAACPAKSMKVGSKVEIKWSNGYWYPATILDESDTQYKVHLDGDGDNHSRDQWINKDKGIIRGVADNTPPPKPINQQQTAIGANKEQSVKQTATRATGADASTELFKEVFVKQLQRLRPEGYERRSVKLVQVIPGKTNSGTTSYKVTAYIHDYDEGYPPNQYYGQTCVGKMDNWPFTMHKDDFGEWVVQGMFTVVNNNCQTNPSQGVESQPLSSVPGTLYEVGKSGVATNNPNPSKERKSSLYIGEYAAYGTGGRLMTGMGIILTADNRYYDLDKKRGGTYKYDQQAATIIFSGGFLSGQKGKNVGTQGFDISETVHYEPWR